MQQNLTTLLWEGRSTFCRSHVYTGFSESSTGKESACNAGNLGLIPGLGRLPGEGNSYPPQDPGLENSMDCIIHGVTRVGGDWATFTFMFTQHFILKEKEYKITNKLQTRDSNLQKNINNKWNLMLTTTTHYFLSIFISFLLLLQ